MQPVSNGSVIIGGSNQEKDERLTFDKVINATGCAGYLPSDIATKGPVSMEVVYQPCLGLVYADLQPKSKTFSFIVMDGWFPCVMPYLDTEGQEEIIAAGIASAEQQQSSENDSKTDLPALHRKYVLTHGNYTIMASCDTYDEADGILK
eukprot:gene36139-44572_t